MIIYEIILYWDNMSDRWPFLSKPNVSSSTHTLFRITAGVENVTKEMCKEGS